MLLQTNSYVVPAERRAEHARLLRRFRQTLARIGCEFFEVYEQVGANWGSGQSSGRFVQIMRFRDRRHQLAVQAAERSDPQAQALIAEFCELINFPYQQQQGLFAVGFYTSTLPVAPVRSAEAEAGDAQQGLPVEPEAPPPLAAQVSDSEQAPHAPEAELAEPIEPQPYAEHEMPAEEPAAADDAELTLPHDSTEHFHEVLEPDAPAANIPRHAAESAPSHAPSNGASLGEVLDAGLADDEDFNEALPAELIDELNELEPHSPESQDSSQSHRGH